MKYEKSSTAELVRTILAVLKSREGLKEDTVLLLADFRSLAVAIKLATQRLSKSAAEISEVLAAISDDVSRSVDSKTVILDVGNHAEEDDAFEREWQNARRAHAYQEVLLQILD